MPDGNVVIQIKGDASQYEKTVEDLGKKAVLTKKTSGSRRPILKEAVGRMPGRVQELTVMCLNFSQVPAMRERGTI